MAFPQTPLQVKVELQLAGTWTDITSYAYVRAPITITRGRSSEAQNVDPTKCSLTLDNRDGRFSPRNPAGPYYGQLTRNTPLRVSVLGVDQVSLQCTSGAGTTPHNAALNVTSDLDLRLELTPLAMYTPTGQNLFGKWDFASQNSYLMWVGGDGLLRLSWSTTGTAAITVSATAPLPRDNGRRFAVRASLVGATGTVTFYWADSIAGPWNQLGDPVVQGATSVFAGTASVSVGVGNVFVGRVYKAEIRTGLGATTVVTNPDFTAQTAGAASFTDGSARTWTVNTGTSLSTARLRFIGEVTAWPVKWDPAAKDIYAPIVASGIMRRLQAGQPPLRSTMRHSIPALSTVKAYWPMEDGSGATSFAYGLTDPIGQYAMGLFGVPSLSAFNGFLASDPIPTFGNGSYARGRVPGYATSAGLQVRFLMNIPATGQPADGTVLCKLTTTASVWTLQYKTGGNLQLSAVDSATGTATTIGPVSFSLDGKLLYTSIELTTSGTSVTANMATLQPGQTVGSVSGGTALTTTLGRATFVQVGAPGTNSTVAIGHVTVESAVTSLFALAQQLNAYTGELATTRAPRLATESGYSLFAQGVSATTMGAQTSMQLSDALRQCADADVGIVYDLRDAAALGIRSRQSMHARDATLVLNYAQQHLASFEPTEDDQNVVNDVTLSRILGSFYEAKLASGALSVQAPPAGIGTYGAAVSVSLSSDGPLRDQANYRLALGTVDEARYPLLGVRLHSAPFVASPALQRAALDVDIGDVIEVDNPPSFYAPQAIFQRVEGYTEVLYPFTYDITYNCSPGTVWRNIAVYNDPTNRSRYDSDTSTLSGGVTSAATTLSVAVGDNVLWTTTDVPFQIMVAGEVMTVTAVSGATSPQTFTVTRSVNGVVKAQANGAAVHVYTPSYYAYA